MPPRTASREPLLESSFSRMKTYICILVGVGLVSLLIALIVYLATPTTPPKTRPLHPVSMRSLLQGNYTPRSFNGSWVTSDKFAYINHDGHLELLTIPDTWDILLTQETLKRNGMTSYSVSADLKYVLISYNTRKVYTYSRFSRYKIIVSELERKKSPEKDVIFEHQTGEELNNIRYVIWGPKSNALIYAFGGNLFYKENATSTYRPVTSDGTEDLVLYGAPDWLYEMDILESDRSVWWAPDGTLLCYSRTNLSEVGTHNYIFYDELLYPKVQSIRFPKAGEKIPRVTLWVADLNAGNITSEQIQPPEELKEADGKMRDYYYTAVAWIDSLCLSVTWRSRFHNYSVVSLCCQEDGWRCRAIHEQKADPGTWVDIKKPPIFGRGGTKWFLKLPVRGALGSFQHLVAVSNVTRETYYFTKGSYDIVEVLAYHPSTHKVYYLSTLEGAPGEQHLLYLYDKQLMDLDPICVTCKIENRECLYARAYFSPETEYYILECLGPKVPRVEIWKTENDSRVMVLDPNEDLITKLDKIATPRIFNFRVKLSSGYTSRVRMFLPTATEEGAVQKYPMIVEAPGGPSNQLVTQRWGFRWEIHMATTQDYVYVTADGRGSAHQGDRLRHEVYKRLGIVEVEDQLEVVQYIVSNYLFINPLQVAIWGWGYGGFVALHALSAMSNLSKPVLKCGIAVAPVSSWYHFSATYSEQYMGPLHENERAYNTTNLLSKAPLFKDSELLLIHGTADERIPFQHSILLQKALEEAEVIFKFQAYPDSSHKLENNLLHLYLTMEDFFKNCFAH